MRQLLAVAIIIGAAMVPANAGAHGRRSDRKLPGGLRAHWQHSTTVLVNPDGQPVGGKWQRWVDQARAPTVIGHLTFDASATVASQCGGAAACSVAPPQPETLVSDKQLRFFQRDDLYFELGHQFDWQRLTDRDRRFLARLWGVPHARWDDSWRGLQQGAEDGLEADFAAAYQSCAWGQFEVGGIQIVEPDQATVQAPEIYTTDPTATCSFIDRVGRRHPRP